LDFGVTLAFSPGGSQLHFAISGAQKNRILSPQCVFNSKKTRNSWQNWQARIRIFRKTVVCAEQRYSPRVMRHPVNSAFELAVKFGILQQATAKTLSLMWCNLLL
jgi:hypothetical protein